MDAPKSIYKEPQGPSLRKQQKYTGEKNPGAKGKQPSVTNSVHGEIADMAGNIRQLKERLLAQEREPEPGSLPPTKGKHGEDEQFPSWLT